MDTLTLDTVADTPHAESPRSLAVAGNDITVFVESPPLFEAMLRDIASAKQRIWLETYIFFNDDGGKRIANALKEKAREGLDVRVLYDAVGSATTPAAFFADMAAAGIKVHAAHSLWESLRRFKPLTILNRRNHRKLFIVDDTAGYFGGMNVIDNVENTNQLKAEHRPKSSGWRDVHLRLAGPKQPELAASFERSWNHTMGLVNARPFRHRSTALPGRDSSGESIHFVDSRGGRFSRASRIYALMLSAARRDIMISMAYFIPVGATLRVLLRARRKRVSVRVIVPGKSDVKIVQRATAHLYNMLLRRGFRLYERRDRMLHSKVMVIDDQYTLVGSANLDPRSLYTNHEFIAVIRSQALARIMRDICKYEISQSDRVTTDLCRRITPWQRFVNSMAWALRWWL